MKCTVRERDFVCGGMGTHSIVMAHSGSSQLPRCRLGLRGGGAQGRDGFIEGPPWSGEGYMEKVTERKTFRGRSCRNAEPASGEGDEQADRG